MPHIPSLWEQCKLWASSTSSIQDTAAQTDWADMGLRAAKKVISFEDNTEGWTLGQRVAALAPSMYEV
eukprot:10047936-Heterocapsa_arctica.AAC.2